jgi:tetratricopeptide (TPR) repeat protein
MSPMPQSIEKLKKKLDKDPGSLVFSQLAEEYRKQGNLEEAESILKQGLTRHPNYWSARVTLARIYQQLGHEDPAREELEQVVRAVPDHLLANRLLGEMYIVKNDPQEALKCLRVVHMLSPADHEITEQVARLEAELAPEMPQEDQQIPEPPTETVESTNHELSSPTVQIQIPEFIEKTDPMRPMPIPSGEFLTGEPPTLKFDSRAKEPFLPQENPVTAEVASPFQMENVSEDERELQADGEDLVVESAEVIENEVAEASSGTAEELSNIANLLLTHEDASLDDTDFQELEPEIGEEPFEEERKAVAPQDRTQPIEEEDLEGDELTTETLAELYLNQGLVDKAVKVYQKLLLSDPGNMQILQRLRELNPDVSPAAEVDRKPSNEILIAEAERSPEESSSEESELTQREQIRRRKIHTLENWLTTIHRQRH